MKADASKLSLKATLHYLWEEAGFNRWSERMTGKRNWFIIRKHLLQAAENKIAKGTPLADVLYIPEVFSAERKTELAQRHLSAVNKIAAGATGPRRLMLLIGEVKEFAAARSGHKLVVKHLPEFSFLLREGLHRRMAARFDRELTLWDAVAGAHLLVIATFGVGSGGVPEVEELALMVVTETWIPIEHIYDRPAGRCADPQPAPLHQRAALQSRPPRGRLQRLSSRMPAPPRPRCTSSRPEPAQTTAARSTSSWPRAPSPLGSGMRAKAQCQLFRSRSGLALLAGKAAAMGTKGGSMASGSARCENREACFCATVLPSQSLHSCFV